MTSLATSEATRAQGLERLAEFVPRAGKKYRDEHGFDLGPDDRSNVSLLSPYLRHGLITEAEVARAVIAAHPWAEVESFLTALSTRAYFKGWLEGRPQMYLAYRRAVSDDLRRFAGTDSYARAVEGRTGIPAYDAWSRELREHGYLHHNARLAFASIWIFTLRMPWSLGAALFEELLLDGDPGVNIPAWRSVAGLHTPGKHHLAKGAAILKMTRGRLGVEGRLNESALSLTGPAMPPPRPLIPLAPLPSPLLGESYALLVTPDDLSAEIGPLAALRPRSIFVTGFEALPGGHTFEPRVKDFVQAAIGDARSRLAEAFDAPVETVPAGPERGAWLGERLAGDGVPHLAYYQPSVGPWHELMMAMTSKDVGLRYFPLRRAWDSALFSHTDKGIAAYHKLALPLIRKRHGAL